MKESTQKELKEPRKFTKEGPVEDLVDKVTIHTACPRTCPTGRSHLSGSLVSDVETVKR